MSKIENFFRANNGRWWHITSWAIFSLGLVWIVLYMFTDLPFIWQAEAGPSLVWLLEFDENLGWSRWAIPNGVIIFLTGATLFGGFIALQGWSCEYGPAQARFEAGKGRLDRMNRLYDNHPYLTSAFVLVVGAIMAAMSQLPLDFGIGYWSIAGWCVLLIGGPLIAFVGVAMVVGTVITRAIAAREARVAAE
jgi:hypothetical protein